MKRIICLALCLLTCIALLASCNKDKEPDESESDTPEVVYTLKAAELAEYAVVYPENASAAVTQAAKDIGGAIMEKFSVQMTVKNDYFVDLEGSQYQKGDKEILVGNTNRDESGEYLGTLRYRDYGYALLGTRLVVLGHHDEEVLKAAEAFSEYISGLSADAEVFFSNESDKHVKGEYNHTEITVGDTNIEKYRIVYPAGKGFEKALATRVSYALAEDCGVLPSIVEDSEAYADGYEILVGKTNRSADLGALTGVTDGTGYAAASGKFIVLAGNTAWGTAMAVDSFIDTFEGKQKADTFALTLVGKVAPSTAMTTMSFNINGVANKVRTEALVGAILADLPDTVGLQEAGQTMNSIKAALGDYYESVGEGDSYILYAKEKFDKVDAGAITNGVVYASLTRKSDKTALMHINAKLDENSDTARQEAAGKIVDFIYANGGMATLLTGDLACADTSAEFLLLAGTDLANATFLVEKVTDLTGGDVLDYVLLDDYYMDIVSYNRGTTALYETSISDRAPITVEYTVNYAGTDMKEEPADSLTVGRDDAGDDFKYPVIIH